MIQTTDELLQAIKELCEKEFEPKGYYYVDRLVRNGQTSIVLHILFDSKESDYYPKRTESPSLAEDDRNPE